MMIKVAIYEDNDSLRKTLSHLIMGTESMELTGAWPDCSTVIQNCTDKTPDVILMDIDLPGIDALCAGATGYLLKKSGAVQIIEAIIELHNGGSPMTGEIARMVLQFFSKTPVRNNNEYDLSAREFDILKCIVRGDSYKMIADSCSISIGTVRTHINNIYKKLHVNSKSEAVIKALNERLI